MKTIIKYILAVPLMFCFSSCLDEHPKDQLDQEAIYNNADNIYKNAVASLCNYIRKRWHQRFRCLYHTEYKFDNFGFKIQSGWQRLIS